MTSSAINTLGNLRENRRGRYYEVTYHGDTEDIDGWQLYNSNQFPHEVPLEHTIWYRKASHERRVTLTYWMPVNLAFIPERYRIEVFVPAHHATVRKAKFTIIERIDDQGNPVEKNLTLDLSSFSREWASLGEYELDIGSNRLIGQVRQYDDTTENLLHRSGRTREISFGPVRWVPLYQAADPLYAGFSDGNKIEGEDIQVNYLVDSESEKIVRQQWSNESVPDFADTRKSWMAWLRRRSRTRQLRVDYNMPATARSGRYQVEVFIPDRRLRSKQAKYSVKTKMRIESGLKKYTEETLTIDQSKYKNQWARLGEFDLQPDPNPDVDTGSLVGQVSQFDDSEDGSNLFITFGPVRWVPRFKVEFKPSKQFDFPIGSDTQREAKIVKGQFGQFQSSPSWLDDWYDASPYLEPYPIGLHTGADLNLKNVNDRGKPIYAAGDGTVTFAGEISWGTWGNIIVIEHPLAIVTLPDGRKIQSKVYTRYGHVSPESLDLVKEGQKVSRGQKIGFIGLMRGFNDAEHLHFDVSHSETLKHKPDHWPNMKSLVDIMPQKDSRREAYQAVLARTREVVMQDYLDPLQFIIDNHQLA